MKRLLIFILPILIVVAIGITIFGVAQVRFTKEKLMDDLKRKAKTVSESLELSARRIFVNNDIALANQIVEMFEKRERMQGCIIYDKNGEIISITKKISDWAQKDKPYIIGSIQTKEPVSGLKQFKEFPVYSYVLPVLDSQNNLLGLVEVIYDTSHLFAMLGTLWRRISVTLIVLLFFITLISFIIQRQIFILPVRRLTQWFMYFQRGDTDNLQPFKEKGEFGKLVSEVEQVALGLRVARRTVSDRANERLQKEEIWTEQKLRNLIQAKLGQNALFIVSNREPYMHVINEATGQVKCLRPASGVVTALDPILRGCGGTWLAQASGNADKKFVNSKNKLGVPPEDNRYILKRVWLTKEEENGYYYGFANEGIWPLCHVTHTRPVFRENDWQMYKQVNEKFAQNVLDELPSKNPFIFIQDYHFTLLPKLIKERRPDSIIALFWHIPWPNPEAFAICPFQHEILEGMLSADLIGFHVQYHCNNFLDTANRLMECRINAEKFSVIRQDKETLVKPFAISVNGYMNDPGYKIDNEKTQKIKRDLQIEDKIIGIGVDRIDYTKGIAERLLALDRFFEKYPQYQKKFVFIQLAAPSRTHIKRYHELISELDELVENKNWKYSSGDWQPIIYLKRNFSADEIRQYYELGDICIVSSLHDGMNLVAKEYVASKSDLNGVLLLSRFTGASRELTDALLINPYSLEEFADAIKCALEMPREEKIRRMENMRKVVLENNVYKWAANIITELTAIKKI